MVSAFYTKKYSFYSYKGSLFSLKWHGFYIKVSQHTKNMMYFKVTLNK